MKQWMAAGALALAALLAGTAEAAVVEQVEQKAVIGGAVQSVLTVGTAVTEGEVLAEVNTLAGPVPAAKASADGTVTEVCVARGDTVARGDVVAVLETAE